jgi:hypothetical protein
MKNLTRDDFAHFSGNIQYRLKLLAQTRQRTDRLLATRFNVFTYICPNENRLSDVIADLLDPHGDHGQGDAFLQEFIQVLCGPAQPSWEFQSVLREKATSLIASHHRRLDIVIDLKSFGIGIENKPWAGEQHAQVGDYVANLERRFPGNYKIIYLSPGGAEPTSIDASAKKTLLKDGKLVLWAYRGRFNEWLRRCHQVCQAEKVRWFLYDLMAYSEGTFNVTQPVTNEPDHE